MKILLSILNSKSLVSSKRFFGEMRERQEARVRINELEEEIEEIKQKIDYLNKVTELKTMIKQDLL